MLNVNELTSQMAKMSDAQLRQYAHLHKTDPYTLALAASESRRRAQLRAAGQQQGAQGQQPTVADQALAQMGAPAPMPQQAQQRPQLPEQQGIGMLPAQNVEGMADGGIAGYDDSYASGGMVAFAGEGPSLVRRQPSFDLSGGNKTQYGTNTTDVFKPVVSMPSEETSSPIGRFFDTLRSPTGAQDYAAQQNKLARERELLNKLQQLEGYGFAQQTKAQQAEAEKVKKELAELRNSFVTKTAPVDSATKPPGWAVAGKKKGEAGNVQPPIDEFAGVDLSNTGPYNIKTKEGRAAAESAQARRPGAGTGAGTGAGKDKQPPPITTTASGFVPTKPGDLSETLQQLQFLSPGVGEYDVLANKAATGFADLEKQREATRPKEKAFTGLEALLGKEEEKAKGKEARNFNMAIVNAGLAIAGGKSQYALQNIAQGAQVGTKQYQEGLDKLEAAAIERRKQAALIEEARRAEDRGDWKDAQQLKQKAFETDLGIKQTQIAAVRDIWGINQKAATELVAAQSKTAAEDARALMQQQEETKRAREQNITSKEVATIYANRPFGGGAGAARGAITPALAVKEYNDMEAKDPMRMGPFFKQFPTQESYYLYLKNLENPTVTNELPANATIRK